MLNQKRRFDFFHAYFLFESNQEKDRERETRSEYLNFIMAGACPKIYCICGKLPEV